MTLDDLKKAATASELTLIETVEKLVQNNIGDGLLKKVCDFIDSNPPPPRNEFMNREEYYYDVMRTWLQRMKDYINAD